MKYNRYIVISALLLLLALMGSILTRQRGVQEGAHETQELSVQFEPSSAIVNSQTQKNAFTIKEPVLVESIQSEESTTPPAGSSDFNVNIGNESYPILFEGEDVVLEMKQAIIDDLNLNLSHYEHMSFMKIPPEAEKEPELQMYKTKVTHWLDDGRQKNFFPDVVRSSFGGAVKVGDSYQLIINQKLINAYEQAFQFKENHLDAFSNANDFLGLLADKKAIYEVGSGNQQIARSIFLFEDNESYDDSQELARFLDEIEIRKPSILDFEAATYEGQEVIRFTTLVDFGEESGEPLLKGYPEFIYMDEKWRIHFPLLP